MTVGLPENIAELRKKHGWTQAMLGEKMQVHTNHVSRWECGKQRPSIRTLNKMADLFGVSIDDLAKEKNPPLPPGLGDQDLLEKFHQVQELAADDRAVIFRIIDTFSTQRRMAKMLAAHGVD